MYGPNLALGGSEDESSPAPVEGRSEEHVAVSRDGKVIVSGTSSGLVTVWDAKTHSKVTKFKAYDGYVGAVDVSPDTTKIVTGSGDNTACHVWSLSTGERLLSPLEHKSWWQQSFHPTDASSPLPLGIVTLFGSMTAKVAASLSSSRSRSTRR